MKLLAMCAGAALWQCAFAPVLRAQAPPSPPPKSPEVTQLENLTKKIEEQNAKIDILSQQILKLQQEITEKRPGVIIGENTPAETAASPTDTAAQPAAGGTTHTVARGETLTSIAKTYHVSVDELQRINRIDNPLKLQAGQTISIPSGAVTPTPSASPPAGG